MFNCTLQVKIMDHFVKRYILTNQFQFSKFVKNASLYMKKIRLFRLLDTDVVSIQ
jgi:hypothetical protein